MQELAGKILTALPSMNLFTPARIRSAKADFQLIQLRIR